MATLFDLYTAIRQGLITATGLPSPQVCLDIPSQQSTGAIARGDIEALVSVFDMAMSRNTTRWATVYSSRVEVVTQAAVAQSANGLAPLGTMTITVSQLGLGFIKDDAIGLTVFRGVTAGGATVVAAVPGDDPTSLAARLVAAIMAEPTLNALVSASSIGGVITLTNLTAQNMQVKAAAGNIGHEAAELRREERVLMVSLWTRTAQERDTLGETIRQWIGQTQLNFGLQMPDGSWVRVRHNTDQQTRDTHMPDLYRWIFTIDCEWGVIVQNPLYTVLGIQQGAQVG